MNIRRRFGAVAGGIFCILLASYAYGETGNPSDSPPPAASSETAWPDPAIRNASGIDLNSVRCAYLWAQMAKHHLDLCNSEGDTELKKDLEYEITATAEFLVASSSHPDAMKQELDSEASKIQANAFPKSTVELICSASPDDKQHGMFNAYRNVLRAIPSSERRAKVTRLLTVPGPSLRICFP